MGFIDWAKGLFRPRKLNIQAIPSGVLEKEFGVLPAASRQMEDSRRLWWDLYTNHPPWETDCVRPLDIPGALGRELARNTLSEFSIAISGSARADYLNQQIQNAAAHFAWNLERGLCLGGIAFKPYPEEGRVLVEASNGFTPTRFDGAGKATGGVFKGGPVRQGREWFTLLEYHDFLPREDGSSVYVIENRAFRSSQNGDIGAAVPLESVKAFAGISGHEEIENLEGPLFAYFKPPVDNRVDPSSPLGVSVYAGGTVDLIRQADEQWERLLWEFRSGERKIFSDAMHIDPGQLSDRLFLKGAFTKDGNLFEEFSPEFRNSDLYEGFQYILKQIEFNVGLAFGTISDPQSVEKTATEVLVAKQRQYITGKNIQRAFESTLDGLIYAMDAWCSINHLAPTGTYQVDYNWGDGVLDDPETRRQDMALDLQLVSAGVMNDWEFRMKWYGEDEDTARAMLPKMEALTTEPQEEVE